MTAQVAPITARNMRSILEDAACSTGDLSAYKYYLQSMGLSNTFIFGGLIVLRTFCLHTLVISTVPRVLLNHA